jgi:dTMP kinase
LEGLDGSGKTTAIKSVANQLRQQVESEIVITREPGGSPVAEKIRHLVLRSDPLSPITETLLIAAGRADHVDKVIRPALSRGALVISDRFFDSSVAYQGFARGVGFEKVLELNLWGIGDLIPDLTFFIDTNPQVSTRRISKHPDRLERLGLELQLQARQGYQKLIEKFPERYRVFKPETKLSEIAAQITHTILRKLDSNGK